MTWVGYFMHAVLETNNFKANSYTQGTTTCMHIHSHVTHACTHAKLVRILNLTLQLKVYILLGQLD